MRILWIPHAAWRIPQREHLFCKALARTHDVHVTDWVADFSSPRDYLSRRYIKSMLPGTYKDGDITVHRVPRISPALPFRRLRQINARVYSMFVERIIDHCSIDVVVGTFVVPPPQAPRVVFDLFDDNVAFWRNGGRLRAYADEIDNVEQRYLQQADAVVAASSVLADLALASGTTVPIYHIPNGIDVQAFDRIDRRAARRSMGFSGQIVGSVGNHDSPSEVDRILNAAQELEPDGVQFLLAGRGSAVPYARTRVAELQLGNVQVLGYVSPSDAATIVAALDVGLCPYAKTTMDDARSPMRLLMYAAAGIPAVCTDLEEVRRVQLSNVVLVNDDDASFEHGIRVALTRPKERPEDIGKFDLPLLVSAYERVLMNSGQEMPG